MSGANPFAALFQRTSEDNSVEDKSNETGEPPLNDILEDIFSFTLNPNHSEARELFYLEDVSQAQDSKELNVELLNHALFDRLFMCQKDNINIIQHVRKGFRNGHATEYRPVYYLYKAYIKLHDNNYLKSEYKLDVKDKIIQNVAITIIQPEIYSDQDIDAQMLEILKKGGPHYDTFFVEAARRIIDEENSDDIILRSFIESMNKKITVEINKMSLVNVDFRIFNYLSVFTANEFLASFFIDACGPNRIHIGSDYANTAIGSLFSLSVLPKTPNGVFEHFTDPTDQQQAFLGNSRAEGLLWTSVDKLNEHIHSFLLVLLKCSPKVKNSTLSWLGLCLKANVDRGKLWNSQAPPELNPANYTTVSDGFMLNFCSIMLRLCRPFCNNLKDKKILKVDPTYPAVANDKAESKGVHMHDLSSETCFIPVASTDELEEERLTSSQYSFITECFFMSHKALDLGFRVGVDRIMKLSHEIARMERVYRDALMQSGAENAMPIGDRLKAELTKLLSLKCVLSEPILLKDMFDFLSATTYWLTQVAIRNDLDEGPSYAPLKELKVTFPLSNKIPDTLKCIPEFLIENIVSYLVFLRRYSPKTFEENGYEKLDPVLTFILIYMGSQQHMKNPHVRARLAEGLESLLPFHKDEPPGNNLGGYQREMLFKRHPHRSQIVKNLMSVFVGIEMTGQSVEFEQKFNYRRPMYTIFEYLWEIPEHCQCFTTLAEEAEQNMEAVNPPLFLRFANLLINDAIFLLDEALANMAKLKEMQQAHDNGEWNQLSPQERSQNIGYMHHVGNLARFDNILGKDTTTTLEKLTSKITIVFTHSTMVDRIAAMLNYFLLNLVGPNKKNFKVKDSKEYSFDPAGTVMDICKIYVNLKGSDAFCLAVSQDGRSYSPNLFSLAEDVLIRIGGGLLIGELKEVADKVAEKAKEYKASEEAMMEAPDHFLDPIMSTLMTDPVTLPSSKQVVDRTTIARHLLSDQTDPFNRSPLTLDQVIPNVELRDEIRNWITERKNKINK
ncbi:ubiquitin conjugation factor E4 A [Cylas formicarius]|uniref:ubiquitin conjugation factor E4 A n=1 Tax=Cylas formicarius TaxID=197179 RepID=UPI00295894F0|nr:ubiquitin conjugation factor E4 A [Cylas formicarius]